jgi:hypothetical protein
MLERALMEKSDLQALILQALVSFPLMIWLHELGHGVAMSILYIPWVYDFTNPLAPAVVSLDRPLVGFDAHFTLLMGPLFPALVLLAIGRREYRGVSVVGLANILYIPVEFLSGGEPLLALLSLPFVLVLTSVTIDYLGTKDVRRERWIIDLVNERLHQKPKTDVVESGTETPEGPVQSCRNCQFCSGVRVIGTDWFVACRNRAKIPTESSMEFIWLKAGLNLPCWREPSREKV